MWTVTSHKQNKNYIYELYNNNNTQKECQKTELLRRCGKEDKKDKEKAEDPGIDGWMKWRKT